MPMRLLSLLLFATACAAGHANRRDTCKPCNPKGATDSSPPAVGQDLKTLYIDILESVKDIHFKKRWEDPIVARAGGLCCAENLDCVKVNNLDIAMCYDKFTTQYAFADKTWGSLTTGEYNANDGSKANLVTGEYTKQNGEQGDIYAQDPAEKPNTATLSIPPQWTEAGVGSAIPATELAGTLTAAPSATVTSDSDSASSGTITPGASATGAQNEEAPAASSTGAAGQVVVDSTRSSAVSLMVALLAIFAA